MPVGEDHVVGVGDARVRDEGEGREDGLRAREKITNLGDCRISPLDVMITDKVADLRES